MLDDLGLIAALEWQTRDFQDRSGINCTFHSNEEEIRLSTESATAAFRIVQEALTNVLRHARATRVEVQVSIEGELLRIKVRDNGQGFSDGSMDTGSLGGSLGLIGMRERAHAVGGEIIIAGESGDGARVELKLPIPTVQTAAGAP